MSNKIRSSLVTDFAAAMVDVLSDDDLRTAVQALERITANYDITSQCRELVVYNGQKETMLKRFLATLRVKGRAAGTIDGYRRQVQRFSDWLWANYQVDAPDADKYAIRIYIGELAARGLKESSLNNTLHSLSSFYGWMVDDEIISKNPVDAVGKVKEPTVLRKAFSDTGIEAIRNACEDGHGKQALRDRAIVEFLLATGCRVSEAVGVNIDDINFVQKSLVVTGKGNKQRTVYLTDTAIWHLRRYLAKRTDSKESLFASTRTERLTDDGIRNMLKRIEARSGVEDVHPHRFRRTCATNLYKHGMPISDIQRVLGHTNINTTMRYIANDDDSVQASFRKHSA